jgi:hypothetical protein
MSAFLAPECVEAGQPRCRFFASLLGRVQDSKSGLLASQLDGPAARPAGLCTSHLHRFSAQLEHRFSAQLDCFVDSCQVPSCMVCLVAQLFCLAAGRTCCTSGLFCYTAGLLWTAGLFRFTTGLLRATAALRCTPSWTEWHSTLWASGFGEQLWHEHNSKATANNKPADQRVPRKSMYLASIRPDSIDKCTRVVRVYALRGSVRCGLVDGWGHVLGSWLRCASCTTRALWLLQRVRGWMWPLGCGRHHDAVPCWSELWLPLLQRPALNTSHHHSHVTGQLREAVKAARVRPAGTGVVGDAVFVEAWSVCGGGVMHACLRARRARVRSGGQRVLHSALGPHRFPVCGCNWWWSAAGPSLPYFAQHMCCHNVLQQSTDANQGPRWLGFSALSTSCIDHCLHSTPLLVMSCHAGSEARQSVRDLGLFKGRILGGI